MDRGDYPYRGRSPSPNKKVTWKDPVEQTEFMTKARDYERDIRTIGLEKARAEALLEDVQGRLTRQEEDNAQARDENANLNFDVDQLITIISTARTTGKWAIENVRFKELSIDQVFGSLHEPLSRMGNEVNDQIHDLKEQLKRRDDLIESLQQESRFLKSRLAKEPPRDQTSSISSNLVTEKDLEIMKLKSEVQQAQQNAESLQIEIQSKDRKFSSLQSQLTDLQNQLVRKESENTTQTQSAKTMQDKHRQATAEVARYEDIIRQLKGEMASLKEQHSQSRHDNSHYERHIRSLEGEMRESKEQRRKALDEIGLLQDRLRDSQVSTQDHHEILKSELLRRDETIQKLRKDVLLLQEKRDAAVSELDEMTRKAFGAEDLLRHQKEESSRIEARTEKLEKELGDTNLQRDDVKLDVG